MKQGHASGFGTSLDAVRRKLRRLCMRILAKYFNIVPLPPTFKAIADSTESETVVTESTSVIIEALLYSFARRAGLNDSIHLGSNSARVRDAKKLYWVANFEEEALKAIVAADPEQKFVTLNIFSGRGPYRNNPTYKLGFWDLFGILVMGRLLIIFIGSPVQASPNLASIHSALVRPLRLDFYKNLKLVRGAPFQPIEMQAKLVLRGAEFTTELEQLAQKMRVSPSEVKRKAEKAFYDLAANPRRPMYRIVAFIARVIVRRLFSSVQTPGLERLIPAVKDSTVVIVPMHRSHLDYILVGGTLYDSHLNPPLVAAGINLSFWPVGFIIRSVGGYFVKRNVRNDRLHALILKRYVGYLVKRGHLQEFFIEGGRSRSGKMRPPKVGLLSIFMDAHLKGYKRDITFVPVSITYENLIEGGAFGRENTGRTKEKENVFALIKARKIFRQKYGDVMIHFGEPISLMKHVERWGSEPRPEGRSSVMDLAHKITNAIREQTNPSLTSLAHTALLMAPHYGLPREGLAEAIRNLARLINVVRPVHNLMGAFTPSLETFLAGKEAILSDIMRGDSIKVQPCVGREIFYIPGERRFVADFYRNATVHLLFESGIFSIMDLLEMNISGANAAPFHNVLKGDFLLEDHRAFAAKLDRAAELLREAGILVVKDGRLQYAEKSYGLFLPALLHPSLQSLIWAVQHLTSDDSALPAPAGEGKGLRVADYDELMKKMQGEFRTAVYAGVMHSTEASSLASLTSSLDTLSQLGMITITEQMGKRKKIIVHQLSFPELDLLKRASRAIAAWQARQE